MPDNAPVILAVDGPPGAGKTSLLARIAPAYGDACTFFTEPNARLAGPQPAPENGSSAGLSRWFLRHEQTRAGQVAALSRDPLTRLILCDRNHLGVLAFCHAATAGDALPYDQALACYQQDIAPNLPAELKTVILLVSPDVSLERRGGAAERPRWQPWFSRDLPVLDAAVRLLDEGHFPVRVADIAAATGLDVGAVDRALDARDAFKNGGGAAAAGGWYVPADVPTLFREREWVENGGAVWTADCPPMLAEVIEAFTACRVIDHIAGFMGERPALSIGKSTLRRVPTTLLDTDWHQDGAFLGADVRAMNVWLALSPCGADAPGLEIVGARLPYVVQTGSHGANFNWSVGPGLVDILGQGGAKLESPEFAPGDALLFDHLMLHRTGLRPGMTRPRWAIESWFFSPTHYPAEQVPLMV